MDKDRKLNEDELLDTPEKVEKFLKWLFDPEFDEQLISGVEVSYKDYDK